MTTKRKAENLLFVDVSMDPKYTSKVWEYFKLEKFAGISQCNECDAILKTDKVNKKYLVLYILWILYYIY